MEIAQEYRPARKTRFRDSSSDALRTGGPGMTMMIFNGLRRAPSGALFVAAVVFMIAAIAIISRF